MCIKQLSEKVLDNITVTAYRVILIFNMLIEGSCDVKDINEKLQHYNIGARYLSHDTVCIYINTLRSIGCKIARPSKKNNFKYELIYNPFKIILDDREINSIIKLKKYIVTLDYWKIILGINKTFCTIIENLTPECRKNFEQVRKESLRLIDINSNINLINTLEKYCIKNSNLSITYFSPESGKKIIKIAADKLCYDNGSIYLWGYNIESEDVQCLRVDRIKEVDLIDNTPIYIAAKMLCVRYKLTGIPASIFIPNKDEKIVDQNEDYIIIESKIKSKFKFIQKVLSFGSNCIVLSPEFLRKEIIEKLQIMRLSYKDI